MSYRQRIPGVPTVEQWDQQHLGSTGTQVGSLAQHSGLSIQCCWGLGLSYSLDMIPGQGNSICGAAKKKKKKRKNSRGCSSWQLWGRESIGLSLTGIKDPTSKWMLKVNPFFFQTYVTMTMLCGKLKSPVRF